MTRSKRRAAEAFPEENEYMQVDAPVEVDGIENGKVTMDNSDAPVVQPVYTDEKAEEIFALVQEELHETMQQLPLEIRRTFALIKELEFHSVEYQAELKELMAEYIRRRREHDMQVRRLAEGSPSGPPNKPTEHDARDVQAASKRESPPATDFRTISNGLIPSQPSLSPTPTPAAKPPRVASSPPLITTSPTKPLLEPLNAKPSNPLLNPSTPLVSLISRIAYLTSNNLITSDERVSAAESALGLLDHHIALVEQNIKDTETSIALGTRPGTHPAALVLPAIVAPSGRLPKKNVAHLEEGENSETMVVEEDQPVGKEKSRERKKKDPSTGKGKKLSIKIRMPMKAVTDGDEGETDADAQDANKPYCYCNQTSYGPMIACDSGCEREWFHIGCTELRVVPRGQWFCRDCRSKNRLRAPKRRR